MTCTAFSIKFFSAEARSIAAAGTAWYDGYVFNSGGLDIDALKRHYDATCIVTFSGADDAEQGRARRQRLGFDVRDKC